MNLSVSYIQNPAYHTEEFDNEVLLYSLEQDDGIYLNQTAYIIWSLFKERHSTQELIALLQTTYPTQKETIGNDIIDAVTALHSYGAIIPA